MREAGNVVFDWKGQFGYAAFSNESILSGEAAVPVFACEYNLEV